MEKKIVFLTGASGVGKTTLLKNLENKYGSQSTWEFLRFDSIGIPSHEEMVKEYGSSHGWQKAKTEEWIQKMLEEYPGKEMIVMDGQANLEFIIEGFKRQNFTNYQIVLIDCEQETMVKRLTDERQQPWLASEDMKNWLKFLRDQANKYSIPVIDTTNINETEVLEKLETIILK